MNARVEISTSERFKAAGDAVRYTRREQSGVIRTVGYVDGRIKEARAVVEALTWAIAESERLAEQLFAINVPTDSDDATFHISPDGQVHVHLSGVKL